MKIFPVVLSVWCAYISGAVADSFVGDEFSAHIDITTDSVVYENVFFKPGHVDVNDTIKFVDDWNPIDADVKYTLMIDGTDRLNLVNGFNGDAFNNIILKDSVLNISDVLAMNGVNIDLQGDVVLVADDLMGLYDVPIIGNVSGDGRVRVVNKNPDVLYSDVVFLFDDKLFV